MGKKDFYVDLDNAGVRSVLNNPETRKLLKTAADNAAAAARASAPVVTGTYRDSIKSHVGTSKDGTRAIGRVSASAPHAAKVEAKHGVLHRAIGKAKI
ncbi:MAG: HK97 gp10 family phage protein [Cellulomonadaceae bacterium]|nr:HK97 gp10 family phage protein [Cellulomonadaceae bacterium]